MGLKATTVLVVAATVWGPLGGHAEGSDTVRCQPWIDKTLSQVEKVSMLRRRDLIALALSTSCAAIPSEVRRAAKTTKTSRAKNTTRPIGEASRQRLVSACSAVDSAASGFEAATRCPLARPEFGVADQALRDMTGADYLVLNVLLASLVAADEYTANAELLLRNFALSAALNGEREREKRPRNNKSETGKKR